MWNRFYLWTQFTNLRKIKFWSYSNTSSKRVNFMNWVKIRCAWPCSCFNQIREFAQIEFPYTIQHSRFVYSFWSQRTGKFIAIFSKKYPPRTYWKKLVVIFCDKQTYILLSYMYVSSSSHHHVQIVYLELFSPVCSHLSVCKKQQPHLQTIHHHHHGDDHDESSLMMVMMMMTRIGKMKIKWNIWISRKTKNNIKKYVLTITMMKAWWD